MNGNVLVSCAVLGIDFGSDLIKVAAVQPGRAFEIVLDEASQRSHPSLVVFDNDVRQYGTQASSLVTRRPLSSFMFFSRLLGKPYDNETMINELRKDYIFNKIMKDEKRNTIRFLSPYYHESDSNDNDNNENDNEIDKLITAKSYTVEEIAAMKFKHIKKMSDKYLSGDVSDCVITVPEFWTMKERKALKNSAQLAGLNVYGLINGNTAAAVQYGLKRDFSTNKTEYMIFYNMGSTSTIVSMVKYWAYEVKEKYSKTRTVGCVDVLSSYWDETLGGNNFDQIVSKLLIEQAKQLLSKQKDSKNKIDKKIIDNLENDERFTARIRNAAKKAKKILSANTETFVGIEGVYNDIDLRATITRDEMYEEANKLNLFERSMAPLDNLMNEMLTDKDIRKEDIEGIVLVGGSSRIPQIKTLLTDYLQKELRQDLNADEASAFGAAFRAANLSSTFRVLGVNVEDITSFPVGIRITDLNKQDANDDFAKRGSLFSKNNNVYKRRAVTLRRCNDLHVELYYEKYANLPLSTSHDLGSFDITGISKACDKYQLPDYNITRNKDGNENDDESMPKISLSFLLDADGIVDLVQATATFTEYITEQQPKEVTNTKSQSEEENTDNKENEEASEETPMEMETVTRKKTHKIELSIVDHDPTDVLSYDLSDFEESHRVLLELDERDHRILAIASSKNELESYIFESRNKLNDDKSVEKVTTSDERDSFSDVLQSAEDWLWDIEPENESEQLFKSKTRELKNIGDKIFLRAKELELRPKAIDAAGKAIGQLYQYVDLLNKNYTWVDKLDIDKLNNMTSNLESWLNDKIEMQSQLTNKDEPILISTDIEKKIVPVLNYANKLLSKQKPRDFGKSKKSGKSKNKTSNANDTSDDSNDDTNGSDDNNDNEPFQVPIDDNENDDSQDNDDDNSDDTTNGDDTNDDTNDDDDAEDVGGEKKGEL